MLEFALIAGVVAYTAVAASIPFVLLWDLLVGDIARSKKEEKRRYRRLVAEHARHFKPPS